MPHRVIASKADLRFFLEADALSSGLTKTPKIALMVNPVLRFQRLLRLAEYYRNCPGALFSELLALTTWARLNRLRIKLGFSIPLNVFGPGLSIAHYGTIVVNRHSRIGENCRIHPGVCIGGLRGAYPRIGDNVYIGPGAKVFGNVSVGDNCAIGANAVVVSDIPEGTTAVGIPARVAGSAGSAGLVLRGTLLVGKRVDWNALQGEALDPDERTPGTSTQPYGARSYDGW